jgi:Clostridial hydrophobic W
MSEAATAVPKPPAAKAPAREGAGQNRVAELRVSGHLMTLDTGLFCVFQAPGSPAANDHSGLPGVRISLPPGPAGRPEAVSISTFRDDGWMSGSDAAALIRVVEGPAQVLVTVYQAPSAPPETAPRLQVMRLGAETQAPGAAVGQPASGNLSVEDADVVVHVSRTGDTPGKLGDWAGTRGSRQWIEGFSIAPRDGVNPADIEYQAVLGRGWLSPWIEGGKFCGSRGMALPLLGLKLRLKGNVAKTHDCSYSATFVDGSSVGPVPGGETCEAESLAALEAFQVVIRRRGGEVASRGTRKQAAQPVAEKPTPEQPTARPAKSAGRRSA